jgi:hypothetical protein
MFRRPGGPLPAFLCRASQGWTITLARIHGCGVQRYSQPTARPVDFAPETALDHLPAPDELIEVGVER